MVVETAVGMIESCFHLTRNLAGNHERYKVLELLVSGVVPVLMVDGSSVSTDTVLSESDLPVQIDCLLQNAGPPEPLTLRLLTDYTDDDLLVSNPPRDPSTCTWTFPGGEPSLFVTSVTGSVSTSHILKSFPAEDNIRPIGLAAVEKKNSKKHGCLGIFENINHGFICFPPIFAGSFSV